MKILPRCCMFAVLAIRCTLPAQTVHVYQTDKDLKNPLAAQANARFHEAPSSGSAVVGPTITVDDTARYQTMDGFGASITDGAAWLLHERLTPKARHKAMTQLFSPTQGIGLSFLRQPIAASDLSRNEYSFDDLPPDRTGETDRGDPALQRFSVSHDTGYVFPVIREALKLNPSITVMATPKWTAMQQ